MRGAPMDHDSIPTAISATSSTVKSIAMVGASANTKPAELFRLQLSARERLPRVPGQSGPAGQDHARPRFYAKLTDIPEPIDMVDIFRASEYALPIVQEALALAPRPQVIWMQLSVRNDEPARAGRGGRH